MLSRDPLEPRLRRYLAEREAARPPVGLEERILRAVEEQPRVPALPWPRQLIAAAVIAALGLGIAAGIAYLRHQSVSVPARPVVLTPAEQAELTALEARPLVNPPPLAADGSCPASSGVWIEPPSIYALGPGPVYSAGGSEHDTEKWTYFDVTLYTDPSVRGLVLIRGRQIGGSQLVVAAGRYAAGPVLSSDVIDGQRVELRSEQVLPAVHPIADLGLGIWYIRIGTPRGSSGCNVLQIDTAAGTEIQVTTRPAR
jgi:hypothetical protein